MLRGKKNLIDSNEKAQNYLTHKNTERMLGWYYGEVNKTQLHRILTIQNNILHELLG